MSSDTTGNGPSSGRSRRKPTTKVKVVASRYALSLQKSNNAARVGQEKASGGDKNHAAVRASSASVSMSKDTRSVESQVQVSMSTAGVRAGLTVDSSAGISGSSGSARQPNAELDARSQSAPKTTSTAGTKRQLAETTPDSVGGAAYRTVSTLDDTHDMKVRLEAYRASKQHRAQQDGANDRARSLSATLVSTTDVPGKRARHTASEAFGSKTASSARPAFPKRITSSSTVERAAKQATPSTSPAPSRHTKLSPRFTKHTGAASASLTAAPVVHHSDSEELELLQSLYYQLCFVEAKGNATFHRQEEAAKQQMIGAWEVLQSKLQLLHDTTLRIDRERHTANLDVQLAQQAVPVTSLAARFSPLVDALTRICSSLASALHRMPTPGVVCSPVELKRHMDALAVSLEEVQSQLASTHLDESLSSAVRFEQAMLDASSKMDASLMQLAHLLEEVHVEIDTETSVAIQKIQQLRIDSATTRKALDGSGPPMRVDTPE